MTGPTRADVEGLAAQCKHNGEELTAAAMPVTGALFDLAADTLLALLARAEAAERERDEMLAAHGQAATDAAQQYQREMARVLAERDAALLPARVAAEIEAEREAIAVEHDCGCAARVDVLQALDGGMRGKDAAARFCPASPNCCAVDARAIRARGPSSALATALRQAEARGMREAVLIVSEHATGLPTKQWTDDACVKSWVDCVNALRAAADAKEKPDAK